MLVDSKVKHDFSLINKVKAIGNVTFPKNGLACGKFCFHGIKCKRGQMLRAQPIEKGMRGDPSLQSLKLGLPLGRRNLEFGFHTITVLIRISVTACASEQLP